MKRNPVRIISSGKGGAGKTTFVTALMCALLEKGNQPDSNGYNFFVVDADPAETLAKALGWEDKVPATSIGELKDKLSEADIPENVTKTKYVLQKVMSDAVTKVEDCKNKVHFSVMGHHEENHCLCAFNTAVNEVLLALYNSDAFDFIISDKEAGMEPINRSVYSEDKDILLVMTWPRPDYLRVAKEILHLADTLGSTKNRIMVVNNVFGAPLTYEKVGEILRSNDIPEIPYFVFPSLGDVFECPIREAIRENEDAQKVLAEVIDYIEGVRAKQ